MAKKRKTDEPKPTGRPSLYSEELADEICARLMEGQSLRSICADEEMPGLRTVFSWLADTSHPFGTKYARAREVQAETLADELIEIADESSRDNIHTERGEIPNSEWISRSKLRIETRQWIATKLLPKKYGNKTDITSGGEPLDRTTVVINGQEYNL